jgi:hypothetical protein
MLLHSHLPRWREPQEHHVERLHAALRRQLQHAGGVAGGAGSVVALHGVAAYPGAHGHDVGVGGGVAHLLERPQRVSRT